MASNDSKNITMNLLAELFETIVVSWLRREYSKMNSSLATSSVKAERARLAKWRRRIFPDGSRIIRTAILPSGYQLRVNVCELVGGDLYFGIPFEPHEVQVAGLVVSEGDTVIDVGANLGLYSILVSGWISSSGRIHAFEPNPDMCSLLAENVRLNGLTNIEINSLAVSDNVGEGVLHVNRESALSSMGETKRGSVARDERILITTLDDYVKQHNLSCVDFLKIDVEGFEGHVLRGARSMLANQSDLVILCELSAKNFGPLGFSVGDVLGMMDSLGYSAWGLSSQDGVLVSMPGDNTDAFQSFLFARPDSKKLGSLKSRMDA